MVKTAQTDGVCGFCSSLPECVQQQIEALMEGNVRGDRPKEERLTKYV